jgi:8-oxo-dGTP pyrophosphatase MutT (NUDIX family)
MTSRSISAGRPSPSPLEPEHLEQVLIHRSRYRDPMVHPRAAVAAIFGRGDDDVELLFIQRATVERDPWSGQMAFPGGRNEATDADSHETAMRETMEEIGLDLSPSRPLGSLTDVDGGRATNRPVTVSGHCFWLPERPPPLALSYEVADVVWVPVSHLLDRDRYIDYWYPKAGAVFPGIQLDKTDQVIWGLTLRFLDDLFTRLGHPFII